MYCSECGGTLMEGSIFCHNCGARTENGAAPEEADPVADGGPGAGSGAEPEPDPRAGASYAPSARAPLVQRAAPAGGRPPGARYFTASAVIVTFTILGWLMLLFGVVGGATAAADCQSFFGDGDSFFSSDSYYADECSAGERTAAFFLITFGGWAIAIFFLWSAYVLRLLSDIETHARTWGSSQSGAAPT